MHRLFFERNNGELLQIRNLYCKVLKWTLNICVIFQNIWGSSVKLYVVSCTQSVWISIQALPPWGGMMDPL